MSVRRLARRARSTGGAAELSAGIERSGSRSFGRLAESTRSTRRDVDLAACRSWAVLLTLGTVAIRMVAACGSAWRPGIGFVPQRP